MNFIKWLQSPLLVVKFQEYFGVERITNSDEVQKSSCTPKELKHQSKPCYDDGDNQLPQASNSSVFDGLLGNQMVGGSEISDSHDVAKFPKYRINNRFWYYLFTAATFTGDELFYTLFIPFWLWNVDGAVMRRVVVFWMVTMYIGQALKDLLKVPRPSSPPVARLDTKWLLEYGLPSTHAAVGLAMPGTVFIFSASRYQIDYVSCAVLVGLWCLAVSASRVYLGMHSVLDVVCGILLVLILFALLVPFMDTLDHALLTHPSSPLVVFGLSVAMVAAYPASASWNPARGDTAVILGVGCGILMGAWLNYQLGLIAPLQHLSEAHPQAAPYPILWPSGAMVGGALLRTVIGLGLVLLTRLGMRAVAMRALCALMQVDVEDYLLHTRRGAGSPLTRAQHSFIECAYKLLTYISIGAVVIAVAPAAFRALHVERPTFYTEV